MENSEKYKKSVKMCVNQMLLPPASRTQNDQTAEGLCCLQSKVLNGAKRAIYTQV